MNFFINNSKHIWQLFPRFDSSQKELTNLDLAFLIDCTSSMGKSIQAAASQMSNIVSAAQTKYGNNVNVAFVGYRDYGKHMIEDMNYNG